MVNCILLMSLCFTILVQAIKRIIKMEPVDQTKLKLYIIVGVIGLAINVMALIILGGLWVFPFVSIGVIRIVLFLGDMSHGHSHGGDSKSKNKKGHKKEEDSAETGDGEHLCADQRSGHDEHHGHSHGPGPLILDSDTTSNGDKKSKKKNKTGCKKKL
jgi:zinc transporter 1